MEINQNKRERLINAFRSGLTPPPDWTVSEWADKRRHLAAESSAEPGRWKTARTPYLREPMDSVNDPAVEYITLIFGAQTGKSETLFNAIGYHADLDPCPMMMVQPTVEMSQAVSKDRITPLFRDSPALSKKVKEASERKGVAKASQTVLQKQFPGGHLTMVGANAPAGLASRPIRIVVADEVDRYPLSAGDEGDPILLAVRRTASFPHNKKIILTSTPTLKGVSRIEKSWLQSDMRRYHVPCPHCGHKQTLEIENVDMSSGIESAGIICGGKAPEVDEDGNTKGCGQVWTEADRLDAVSKGEWIAERPWVTSHRGYMLSGLYSPWYTIPKIMKEYQDAKDDPALYRTFVNTVLGLPYADETDHIEESELIARMEPIGMDMIPEHVLAMTAGVDIQQDRAEIVYLGWSEHQMWLLGHEVIYGDPTGSKLWEDLDEALSRDFQHELGGRIRIDARCVDSGNWTQAVYNFCRPRYLRNYYAIKGVPGDRMIWEMSKSKLKGGGKLFLVGTDTAKTTLITRLKISDPAQASYVHIADFGDLSQAKMEQLLSEYREITLNKGRPQYTWHRKPGRRAEILDCVVYGIAGRETFKPLWDKRREDLTVHYVNEQPKKSGWDEVASMYD